MYSHLDLPAQIMETPLLKDPEDPQNVPRANGWVDWWKLDPPVCTKMWWVKQVRDWIVIFALIGVILWIISIIERVGALLTHVVIGAPTLQECTIDDIYLGALLMAKRWNCTQIFPNGTTNHDSHPL